MTNVLKKEKELHFEQFFSLININRKYYHICEVLAKEFGDNSFNLKLLILLICLKEDSGELRLTVFVEEQIFLQEIIKIISSCDLEKDKTEKVQDVFLSLAGKTEQIVSANKLIFSVYEDNPPVVISEKYLYFYKYFKIEKELLSQIAKRSDKISYGVELTKIEKIISKTKRHVKETSGFDLTLKQQEAIRQVLLKKFLIITGGPGTGKTTLCLNLMRASIYANKINPLTIFLLAPTGKAASRISESILQGLKKDSDNKSLEDDFISTDNLLQVESMTIHRLLSLVEDNKYFFQNDSFKQLAADLVIVDEASMVPIDVLTRLLKVVPDESSMILIGDKNQLSAVKSSSVFYDLIPFESDKQHRLNDSVITLNESKRSHYELKKLIDAVFLHDTFKIKELLFTTKNKTKILQNKIDFRDLDKLELSALIDQITDLLVERISISDIKTYLSEDIGEVDRQNIIGHLFECLNGLKVLCVTNFGEHGVISFNRLILNKFQEKLGEQLVVQPIMITENDYQNNLFNGDQGIIVAVNKAVKIAFFPTKNGFKQYSLFLLKNYTLSFAITIHKSQGSEFNSVIMVLPKEHISIMTKELIYTGLTRAKQNILVYSKEHIFLKSLDNIKRRDPVLSQFLINYQ